MLLEDKRADIVSVRAILGEINAVHTLPIYPSMEELQQDKDQKDKMQYTEQSYPMI